jgi:hypothetical protein
MTIDYLTCMPIDVIRRSRAMHPSLLRDAIHAAGNRHFQYASQCGDKLAAHAARNAGKHANEALHCLDCEDFERLDSLCGPMVQAFTQAARLLCLSHNLTRPMLDRWTAANIVEKV